MNGLGHEFRRQPERFITGAYVIVGLVWVIGGGFALDAIAAAWAISPGRVDILKDSFFIAITAILLHRLISQWSARQRATLTELESAGRELREFLHYQDEVREREQGELAATLHDDVGASLTACRLDLALLRRSLKDEPERVAEIQEIEKLVGSTIETVRNLSTRLRPAVLDQLGLAHCLTQLADQTRRRNPGCQCLLDNQPGSRLEQLATSHALAAYRIIQEALSNAVAHASASHIWIQVLEQPDGFVFKVEDDGKGITPAALSSPRAFGLKAMRERALAAGGQATIGPRTPAGTSVQFSIPAPATAR